jgi:hypothetical protein
MHVWVTPESERRSANWVRFAIRAWRSSILAVARLRIQGAAYTASRLCTEPLMY